MQNNTNNWGLNFFRTSERSTSFDYINIFGCNQDVRRSTSIKKLIITAIPLVSLEDWYKEVEGFTLDKYLEILNTSGFPCRLATVDEIEQLRNINIIPRTGGDQIRLMKKDFVFIAQDLDYDPRINKTYYYTFCLLRHLYYNQDLWKKNVVIPILQGKGSLLDLAANLTSNPNMHTLFYIQSGYVHPQIFEFMKRGLGNSNFSTNVRFIKPDEKYFLDTKVPSDYFIYLNKGGLNTRAYLHVLTKSIAEDKNNTFVKPSFPSNIGEAKVAHVYDSKKSNSIGTMLVDDLLEKNTKEIPVQIQVFSRHPTHDVFRDMTFDNKSVLLRLGSLTKAKRKYDIEINSEEAIMNSSNKYLMKKQFNKHGVPTAIWFSSYDKNDDTLFNETTKETVSLNDLPYPIISKPVGGSRAKGVLLHPNAASLRKWANHRFRNLENYIFEKYYNFSKEYRVHATQDEAFLVWRKMQDPATPEEQKHIRNNSNCTWVGDDNPKFEAPVNYKEMLSVAILAVRAVGLSIGGCDIRIQSNDMAYTKKDGTKGSKPRERCEIVVIEVNSACSQAERTSIAYKDIINKIVSRHK